MWYHGDNAGEEHREGDRDRGAPGQPGTDLVSLGGRPETGVIVEKGHPLEGEPVAGRVLAFEFGKGSTVGSYVLYALSRNGHAPAAIVNKEAEPIIVTGAILGRIPMIDHIDISRLRSGAKATVNGDTGELSVRGRTGTGL